MLCSLFVTSDHLYSAHIVHANTGPRTGMANSSEEELEVEGELNTRNTPSDATFDHRLPSPSLQEHQGHSEG